MGKRVFAAGIGVILLMVFILLPVTAEAKVLPQAKAGVKNPASVSKNLKSAGIGVVPRLRSDRKALMVYFSSLQNASAVSYFLTYKTSVQDEGAMGSMNLTGGSSQTSELLFGTCSKNVCRYHTGIHDAKLDISYTLKSGKKYLRKYKIKV